MPPRHRTESERAGIDTAFKPLGKALRAKAAAKVAGCVECGGTALYRVGTKGYCGKHHEEARRQQRSLQSRIAANVRYRLNGGLARNEARKAALGGESD